MMCGKWQVQRHRWVGMPAAKTQGSWQGSRVHYLKMPPGAATDCQRSAQKLPGTAASTVLLALPPAATLALAPAADGGAAASSVAVMATCGSLREVTHAAGRQCGAAVRERGSL